MQLASMYGCTSLGAVGGVEYFTGMVSLVVLACTCENLHVYTVCIWLCEHAWFCAEVFMRHMYIFIHLFKSEASFSSNSPISLKLLVLK